MADQQAVTAGSFVQTLGLNLHLDFGGAYSDLTAVESEISYLGISNLRDSAGNSGDLSTWQQVAEATGAKFDAYIGQTSPDGMQTELGLVQQLAQEGILNFVEGGNEEDDSYPASQGNNLGITAQFQAQLFGVAQSLGLPTINMSFGAGWTAANNWIGDYANVGDLSGITDYANAHTYPQGAPDVTIQQLNADAQLAAGSRPVITTELGYDISSVDSTQAAKWTLDSALDSMKDGDAKTYFYALYDDAFGAFGLFNTDGSPRPAADALHNLTTLLGDSGGSFSPGSLDYSLGGTDGNDNSLLMQKSDGTYWLALWNETDGAHTVTVNLGAAASEVDVFDPLTGTSAVQTASNTNSVQVTVPDHPVLVEIVPNGTSSGGGTTAPPPVTTPPPVAGSPPPSGGGSDTVLGVPASVETAGDQPTVVSGISLTDPYAASNSTPVTVTITDGSGTLSTVDAWGNEQQGSGSGGLTLSGTIWQVNAGLANLTYAGGSDTISITSSDQAGNQATASIGVDGAAGSGGGGTSSGGTGDTTGGITIDPGDANPVETVSSTAINASAGDHMIFLSGTGDTLTATGGTEAVQSYVGGNSITTGTGNDTINFAGSGNTVDAGGGDNLLTDSGSGNTIVLPGAGEGWDNILGWVTQNGDMFDLRPALAQTGWNGDPSTLGDFVQVWMSGTNAEITIDPAGTGGANGSVVATLNDAVGSTTQSFLAQSIT